VTSNHYVIVPISELWAKWVELLVRVNEAVVVDTDESVNVELQRGVVALLGVVEMNEEENVRPDVMLLDDVLLKALPPQPTHATVRLC